MKSIKIKLLLTTSALITAVIIGISSFTLIMAANALEKTNNQMMEAMAIESSKAIESRISEQLTLVEMIASRSEIIDSTLTVEEKLAGLSNLIKEKEYIKIGIADLKGNMNFSNATTTDISDREYFQKALQGEANVSDPLMSKTEGITVVIFAVPIMQNDKIVGVLTATKSGDNISGLVNDITFGKTGKAFMINSTGVKIAHYNNELVLNMDNDLVNVETNKDLIELVGLEQKMIKGETGVGAYRYDSKNKLLAYAPVGGTNWSLAISVEKNEVLSELAGLIKIVIILAVIFLIISLIVMYLIANDITNKIKIAINYIIPISKGDFTNTILDKHLNIKDEIGQMIQAVNMMQQSIKGMLQLIISNSYEIDTDAQSLSAVSQQMSASSEIVANSIQEVAKGTISQTELLTSITQGLNKFSNNIDRIAIDVKAVDISSQEVMKLSANSSEKMISLSKSVENTNNSFGKFETGITHLGDNINKINEITKLINAISEQTNLLSLNAAIEAARAGESGRGFAVVAEEIRRLAEQSKESSVNISILISNINKENGFMIDSTNAISKEFAEQTNIINSTISSFHYIVEAVESIIPKIVTVSASTEIVNNEKNEIISKIEDISAISEETSASSEEISASTEEMTSSSEDVANSAVNLGSRTKDMMQEIEKFKL